MTLIQKRLLGMVPLIFGITLISFMLMQWAPGDPVDMFIDPNVSMADVATIRQNLGLDKPITVQYFSWLGNVFKGNLGYSYVTGKPVLASILERLPATLLLSLSSLILILLLTLPLGLLSGYYRDSKFDNVVTVFTFIGLSIPTFWLGLMLILGLSLKVKLLPAFGFLDPNLIDAGFWKKSLDITKHMALPLLTIVIGGLAGLTRYHRFEIIGILKQDFIQAARARGISERLILFKHAFKNAALPLITILGLDLPSLFGGSFVIEFIFSWPGMGQLGINAVFARDYPVLMGILLMSSILIIVGNLLADLSYAKIDPRIRQ